MNDDEIKHMVERFLQWRLPENFNPDGGISFKQTFNEHTSHPLKHEPVGTNLFDATQAEAMVRYMIEGCNQTDLGLLRGENRRKTMQPHQQRVVNEKAELDSKLENLLTFIGAGRGTIFSTLVTEERERLTTQARLMREYSDILADRIAAF